MRQKQVKKWWRNQWRIHRRWMVLGLGVLAVVVVFQLAYPRDKALPFARITGEPVGLQSRDILYAQLAGEYGDGNINTTVNGQANSTPLIEAGIAHDADAIISGVSEAPWYMRILPFGLFLKGAFVDQPVTTHIDENRFALYAQDRVKECYIAPKDAGAAVKDDTVVLRPAKPGKQCSVDSIRNQVEQASLDEDGLQLSLDTTPIMPKRTDDEVKQLLSEANSVASRIITIVIGTSSYTVDKQELASWLVFPESSESKELSVDVGTNAVVAYLKQHQNEVYRAPGTTIVTTKDGIETGRVTGAYGQGIDYAKTARSVRQQVLTGNGTVVAALTSIEPTLVYKRSYSKTPAGLRALVNDIASEHTNMAISVRKLGDNGVSASGDKQYHPASTYKLLVAYSVLKRIDSERMRWGQSATSGHTVSQCFDSMIIYSDNDCAEWFGTSIGWSTIGGEISALGLSRTSFGAEFKSTANDLALFLQKLESNQLRLKEASRARLLDAMKRQIFRQGIPAGIGSTVVADKVGFLDGLLHDAAIIYGKKGVYVLVVMSDKGSWANIADATQRIHRFLN